MEIKVNGKSQQFDSSAVTLTTVLLVNQVKNPDMVSVQLNGEFVKKTDYATKALNNNDEVEYIYFMGGGQQ